MAKFQMNVVMTEEPNITARVSDSLTAGVTASWLMKEDQGKFAKMIGDSQYGLAAVGNEIEGIVIGANEAAPNDGFSMGSLQTEGRVKVTFDGLQATPGTGTIAVGDYVVAGTVVARGTSLAGAAPKVCKATAAATGIVFKWRVVSILVGTGAVGGVGVIEFVG